MVFARNPVLSRCLLLLLGAAIPCQAARGQSVSHNRGLEMLYMIKADLKEHYYDPDFGGMDLDARFRAAAEKVKAAQSYGAMFSTIAQALSELEDSHTYLIPPYRGLERLDYGWAMRMVGDGCYVVWVRPGGDAERKGLRAGDRVLSIDGHAPTRAVFWKIEYSYYTLMPRPSVRLAVSAPGGGPPREVEVVTKGFKDRPPGSAFELPGLPEVDRDARRPRCQEIGARAVACKVPTFLLGDGEVDGMMKAVAGYDSLILDLRGNRGGYVDALERVVGYFFERDVKVADEKTRRGVKPWVAKTRGGKSFRGRLVVLADSRTGSASEMFARVVQMEKRGAVVGDRTAGAVRTSVKFVHPFNKKAPGDFYGEGYGVSVTTGEPFMADGRSLERVGVTPDETVLPSPEDLAAGRDPAMAYAAALLGIKLEPGAAGSLFRPDGKK